MFFQRFLIHLLPLFFFFLLLGGIFPVGFILNLFNQTIMHPHGRLIGFPLGIQPFLFFLRLFLLLFADNGIVHFQSFFILFHAFFFFFLFFRSVFFRSFLFAFFNTFFLAGGFPFFPRFFSHLITSQSGNIIESLFHRFCNIILIRLHKIDFKKLFIHILQRLLVFPATKEINNRFYL